MFQTRRYDNAKDEYYTTREEIEYIFTQLIDTEELRDKIVYCPCDTDKSEFTIWLEEHKEEYELKELIHTSDDMFTHEDLFIKADIIITNPPFSAGVLRPLLLLLQKYDKDFFFLLSLTALVSYYNWLEEAYFKKIMLYPRIPFMFLTPSNEYKYVGQSIYASTIKTKYVDTKKYDNDTSSKITLTGNIDGVEYKAVDRIRHIPYDEEVIIVPTTFIVTDLYREQFNVLDITSMIDYNDGKSRFKRLIVKRKPEFVGQKL